MVERLVEADVAIDPVTWYKTTDKARTFIEGLFRRYVDELKKNLERFHPFYAQEALEASQDANHDTSSEVLESMIQSELRSEFWKERLVLAEC